jgi:hypothetical protein
MTRRPLHWLLLIAAGAAGGCATKPYLSDGDANSAEVGFTGNPASATELAREHCARYEKGARFLDASENIAYFACEPR